MSKWQRFRNQHNEQEKKREPADPITENQKRLGDITLITGANDTPEEAKEQEQEEEKHKPTYSNGL